jgi:hypothetical protein
MATLHMVGVHCVAHRTSLIIQPLSFFLMVFRIENLFQNLYTYFIQCLKQTLELQNLIKDFEIKVLKIFEMLIPIN